MPTATSSDTAYPADAEVTSQISPIQSAPTAPTPEGERTAHTADQGTDQGTDQGAGQSLVAEAKDLLGRRKWTQAAKVALSAKRLRPDDITVDGILAISAANNWRRTPGKPIQTLRTLVATPGLEPSQRAIGYSALSAVALAERDYAQADEQARRAVELDPKSADAWWGLSASFAGLGWFEESSECRRKAEVLEPEAVTNFAAFNVGRSINHWAMSNIRMPIAAVALVIVFGILGLAIAVTWPFMAREFRTAQLDEETRAVADRAWIDNRAPRIIGGIAVLILVALWAASLSYTG